VRVWLAGFGVYLLLLSACGGGSSGGTNARSNRLTVSQYRTQLHTIAAEGNAAQHAVERGFQSSKLPQLVKILTAFEASEKHIGDQVAALKPPTNAQTANTELAKGLHDTAAELQALIPKIKKMPSANAAVTYLEKTPSTKGGREVDAALAQLKKLGYIRHVS
jgi:hypothetical protein